MKRAWVFFLWMPLFAAGTVPNRYIVEFSNEPVAERLLRTAPRAQAKLLFRSPAALQHRALIRAEQSTARAALAQVQGKVLGTLENVSNALIVEIPDAQSGQLAGLPGVRNVYPVREFHLLLDHALALHNVPQAWSQIGRDKAGAGIKIGLIDTGIEISRPGFQDSSLPIPSGFPVANNPDDLAFTNHKVIVARSYADLFRNADPDPSPRDHAGHGTATAMAAAGVLSSGPLANISGVAPKAYLGSYKVFGTPGINDNATESAILKAIDDAVADGMDVISMSLGSDLSPRFSDDLQVQALERASALGIIVVVAAGNNGPDPGTIGSPATAPSVIAVGASSNDRTFLATVLIAGNNPIQAVPGSGVNSPNPISGPLVDVSQFDNDGLGCNPLPPNSLASSVALILRGTCTFEAKLNNAAAAGAVGALVYTDAARPNPIVMAVGSATLPAEMVSYPDGLSVKQNLTSGVTATLNFTLAPSYINPAMLADFSAKGPNVDYSIKPDLVAVGTNLYTAAETTDPSGPVYNPLGYSIEQGTSFSTPLVAGAAALLKVARPGLSAGQYRSLLVNSAATASLTPPGGARVQQAGAGLLDVLAALNATAAVAPVSLTFGVGPGDVTASRTLTVSNVGTTSDTFTFAAVPREGGGPIPQLSSSSLPLNPGASANLTVNFTGASLAPGQYEGYIAIQGSHSGVVTHVPYWYAVPSGQPHYLTLLNSPATGGTNKRVALAAIFRISDEFGLPVPDVQPEVTVLSGGGQVLSVDSLDPVIPNVFGFSARLGVRPGANVFRIQVGDLTKTVTIVGQ